MMVSEKQRKEKIELGEVYNCLNCQNYMVEGETKEGFHIIKRGVCKTNHKPKKPQEGEGCPYWKPDKENYAQLTPTKDILPSLPILKVTNYLENTEEYRKQAPFIYDRSSQFWKWNPEQCMWEPVDKIDLFNDIEEQLQLTGETVKSQTKNAYLEAFRRVGRKNLPKDPPKAWLQFKNKIYDLKTGETFPATPKYFVTNPIPWEIGNSDQTPTMDKLITEWVGSDYKQSIYELIAYCCYQDYPLHLIFCLFGKGRNGKTALIRMITKFVGQHNTCSTELEQLCHDKFETFKLYKKLVCQVGETNFTELKQTSKLKKLSGGDQIGFEKKHGAKFDDYNYATLLIGTNNLPPSEDTSDGYHSRWFIIPFPNQFPEGKDIISTIPEVEYENLARKVTQILPNLLKKGIFDKQGSIEERRNNYILASNPFPEYLHKECVEDPESSIRYSILYKEYLKFLKEKNLRKVSKKEFSRALETECIEVRRTSKCIGDEDDDGRKYVSDRWVEGFAFQDPSKAEAAL